MDYMHGTESVGCCTTYDAGAADMSPGVNSGGGTYQRMGKGYPPILAAHSCTMAWTVPTSIAAAQSVQARLSFMVWVKIGIGIR